VTGGGPERARIVVIDDEAALRAMLGEMLADAGYDTELAADGVEGLAVLRRQATDLVLCDINMPGLDGFGVLRAIRADPRLAPLPFVFLTSETEIRPGMLSGADDYLVKPVSRDDLVAAITARLARGGAARREADRRADEMRRAVAILLPHELRTPLTTIMGLAELLQESHGELGPQDVAKAGRSILRAALRLHRMAENYILYADLELRRLSTPRPGMARPELSGSDDVSSAAQEASAHAGRSADLGLDLHEADVPLAAAYLRKVVSELCGNAFKFSRPGTAVHVSLRAEGPGAVLEVADRGRGMTASQVRMVGAFQQFDRGRFEQQGSGVGLALVRGIAEEAGGGVEIDSRPDEGTTVRIRWPGC
jgi:signal transduction histidine kinase